ncbi:MAG: hypothetical protein F6K48_31590 [Okeania sp. SIO3H1]|uniref:hypothetical protein n=1 Tax=Okeania sp. SIO1I7 TaxID=2607772 RepID=UPI0013CC5C14|nr:hypothetical protein [Okeania sp. SIO1I7]NEN93185.1 hypothetical protein [Okeania sp. SIO3H1]NET28431.1 hypothetical protein [Okeania sp. SIO1I7]
MDLEMVLNELSLETPVADTSTALKLMSELIQTLIQAKKLGVKILRTDRDLNYIELAPNYPIASWRNDREVDREERRFFRSLITKVPLWSDVAEEIKSKFDLSEVWHQGKLAEGIRFALISDSLAVSLLSKPQWDTDFLELQITELDKNEQLTDYSEEIVHASRSSHVKQHTEWIKNRIQNILFGRQVDGQILWERREEFFPGLIFCEQVSQQLQHLNIGNPILQQVKKRLFELEQYCKTWKTGAFNKNLLPSKTTPESDSRIQQFRQELTIKCPDGKKLLFSWHLRMTPGAWRLYFSEELGPGKIIIGYIGLKLK